MSPSPKFRGKFAEAEGRPGQLRCTDLWFADGSIVFQASDNILFKLYLGFLAAHSPFFRDLFSLPQPKESQDTYDGVPVVQMQESANDLYCLFQAIFSTQLLVSGIEENDTDEVAALLRLSAKYDLPNIKKAAILNLDQIFPSDWSNEGLIPEPGDFDESTLFLLANAARETDTLHLLPAILLCCVSLKTASIMQGVEVDGLHVELNPDNKLAALQGTLLLHEQCRQKAFRTFQEHLRSESRPACLIDCVQVRVQGAKELEKYLKVDAFNPSSILRAFPQRRMLKHLRKQGYCHACETIDLATIEVEREEIWNGLPAIFGLQGWDIICPDDGSENNDEVMES